MLQDDKKQKINTKNIDKQVIGIFIVIGFAAIIFGFLNFRQGLHDPFKPFMTDYNKKTNEQEQALKLAELKTTDSDGDGLNDFDELYQYNTSPYIADSDSDGISDSDEINKGSDPNCSEGRECLQTRTDTSSNGNINGTINASDLTPDQLRNILVQNGVPQASLDKMDDEILMKYYQEVLASTRKTVGETNANISQKNTNDVYANLLPENVNSTASVQDLNNLSADEIRKLLVSTGELDEASLANISDEQLKSIFQESIKNQEGN